jgi:hypothetical protein
MTDFEEQPAALWPRIVVLVCISTVAIGAVALLGWIVLALLGY